LALPSGVDAIFEYVQMCIKGAFDRWNENIWGIKDAKGWVQLLLTLPAPIGDIVIKVKGNNANKNFSWGKMRSFTQIKEHLLSHYMSFQATSPVKEQWDAWEAPRHPCRMTPLFPKGHKEVSDDGESSTHKQSSVAGGGNPPPPPPPGSEPLLMPGLSNAQLGGASSSGGGAVDFEQEDIDDDETSVMLPLLESLMAVIEELEPQLIALGIRAENDHLYTSSKTTALYHIDSLRRGADAEEVEEATNFYRQLQHDVEAAKDAIKKDKQMQGAVTDSGDVRKSGKGKARMP